MKSANNRTFLFFAYILVLRLIVTIKLNKEKIFKLNSLDINQGKRINVDFTADGKDYNPEITWDQNSLPTGTKSLAHIVEDPDAPNGTFYHWILINIPVELKKISRNSIPGKQLINSWGLENYKGPHPPKGLIHHYYYKVFALSKDEITASNAKELYTEINKYKLSEDFIMVTYSR